MSATSMHGIFQAQGSQGQWFDVVSHHTEPSDTWLFDWLGGNGSGNITPIHELRGLPADFYVNDKGRHPIEANIFRGETSECYTGVDSEAEDVSCLLKWMGQHTHSWLISEEILDAPDQYVACNCFMKIEAYRHWDGISAAHYIRSMPLGAVVSSPDKINGSTTHVRVVWRRSVREGLDYFINEVQRLQDTFGKVRYVFGFNG